MYEGSKLLGGLSHVGLVSPGAVAVPSAVVAPPGGLRPCGCVPMCPICSAGRSPNVSEEVVGLLSSVLGLVRLLLVTSVPRQGMVVGNRTQRHGLVQRRVHRRLLAAESEAALRYREASLMLCPVELVWDHCPWPLDCRRRSLTL